MIFLKPKNLIEVIFQLILNSIFRLRTSIKKKLNLSIKNKIFISGDFFESLSSSKVIFKTLKNFPKKKDFEKFKNKIWIFHNSDETFGLDKQKKLNFFLPIKCFSQNLIVKKKNFHFLPIGLENSHLCNNGDIEDFLYLRKLKKKKVSRILFGFNFSNLMRKKLIIKLRKIDILDETAGWNSYIYRRILLNYMFVICPDGNGIDTHRFWEALYLKTIPIIKKNKISGFLKEKNLPVIILEDWADLKKYDEKNLNDLYASKKKLFNNKYLTQMYWRKKIIQ